MPACEFCGTEQTDLHGHMAKEHGLWPFGTADGSMYYAELKTFKDLKGGAEPSEAPAPRKKKT